MASHQHLDKIPEIRIRSFTPEDHEMVRDMFVAGMLDYCPEGENQELRDYIEHSLNNDLSDIQGTYFSSGGHFWVATIKNEKDSELIIGSIGVEGKDQKHGELRRLSVRKEFRRYGLARTLIAHLEKWSLERGFERVILNTDTDMKHAIKLYNALGFTETNRELLVEEPKKELVFFEKALVAVLA